MLKNQIDLISNRLTNIEVIETFKRFSLSLTSENYDWEMVLGICSALENIPSRDSFQFSLELDGVCSNKVSNTSSDDISYLEQFFLGENDEQEELVISLYIEKKVQNKTLSIYSLSNLQIYIEETKLQQLLISLGKRFDEGIYFEVYEQLEAFGSETIRFLPFNAETVGNDISVETDRNEKLNFIKENSSELLSNNSFLATDFFMKKRSKNISINNFFDYAATALTFASFANISSLVDDSFSFKINGFKSAFVKNKLIESFSYDTTLLNKLISWLLGSGQREDKLGLIRNVISLHVDDGNIVLNDHVWNSIRSNYSIYLKENIQQYIELKNKLTDYIFDHTSKIQSLTDEYLANLRGNFTAIIGFIVSVVIVNGLKDSGLKDIFSKEYLYIVISISLISLFWMWFSNEAIGNRVKKAQSDLRGVLDRNYKGVIVEEEIETYLDPAITSSQTDFDTQIKSYQRWWVGLLLCFVAIFFLGNCLFSSNVSLQKNKALTTQQNAISIKNSFQP